MCEGVRIQLHASYGKAIALMVMIGSQSIIS